MPQDFDATQKNIFFHYLYFFHNLRNIEDIKIISRLFAHVFCVASRSELVEITSVSNARSLLTLPLYDGGMALVARLYASRRGRRSNARHTITTYPIYSFQRQRSISLSSLDSENELELDGKSCAGPVGVSNRACRSQTSTHSLNEADLVQVNFRDPPTRDAIPSISRAGILHSEFFFDRANIRR